MAASCGLQVPSATMSVVVSRVNPNKSRMARVSNGSWLDDGSTALSTAFIVMILRLRNATRVEQARFGARRNMSTTRPTDGSSNKSDDRFS